jgi:hypothetical protein
VDRTEAQRPKRMPTMAISRIPHVSNQTVIASLPTNARSVHKARVTRWGFS